MRLIVSLRELFAVAFAGGLLALAMIYGCASANEPRPPPGGGDCQEHCNPILSSGGSQVAKGGSGNDASGGDSGVFGDVNPPAFDGNLTPGVDGGL